MAEHLSKTDGLYAPRQMRFPSQFVDDVQSLVQMLIKDIVDRYVRVCDMWLCETSQCWAFLWVNVGHEAFHCFLLTTIKLQ